MQISFDPLAQQEAAAVRAMLDALHAQQVGQAWTAAERDAAYQRIQQGSFGKLAPVSELYAGPSEIYVHSAPAPSAAPLDPASSTAAADLFSIAPVAPPATSATIVPAPPVPSAPIPPAPPAPAASASPAGVDSTGLPWDERIHSGTKAKNADGTWRARRGLNNPALVKEVEAELRTMMAVTSHPGHPMPGDDAQLDAAVAAASAGPLSQPAAPAPDLGKLSQTEVAALRATVPAAPPIPAPPATTATVGAPRTAPTPAANVQAQAEPSQAVPAVPVTVPVAPIVSAPETGMAIPQPVATAQPAQMPDLPNAATTTSAPPTAPIPSPPAPDAAPQAPSAPVTFGALMTTLTKAVSGGSMTTEQVKEIVARHGVPNGEMGKLATMPQVIQLIAAEVALLQGV